LADLSVRLDALAEAIDGADGAPTQDAKAGYQQTAEAAQKALANWAALKSQEK
jgi:hypothetical protein